MKVFVDPDKCRGHARCIATAPDEFDFLDQEDRAVARPERAESGALELFQQAARDCPEGAISVEVTTSTP